MYTNFKLTQATVIATLSNQSLRRYWLHEAVEFSAAFLFPRPHWVGRARLLTASGRVTDLTGSGGTGGRRPGTCAARRSGRTGGKQWRVLPRRRPLWRSGRHVPPSRVTETTPRHGAAWRAGAAIPVTGGCLVSVSIDFKRLSKALAAKILR